MKLILKTLGILALCSSNAFAFSFLSSSSAPVSEEKRAFLAQHADQLYAAVEPLKAKYPVGEYWNKLNTPVKSGKGHVRFYFTYGCEVCDRYFQALKGLSTPHYQKSYVPITYQGQLNDAVIFYALAQAVPPANYEHVNTALNQEVSINPTLLENGEALQTVLKRNGVDLDLFKQAMSKPETYNLAMLSGRFVKELTRKQLPLILINGEYYLTPVSSTLSAEQLKELIQFVNSVALLSKE